MTKQRLRVRSGLLAIAAATALLGSGAAMAQQVVHIGFSGPLSGGAAKYGQEVLDGMQMAAADVNQAGIDVAGKKIKLEIVPLDDKYNPSETAINARRLAQEQQAAVVLVPHSGGGFAVQTSNEQQKLLLLSYTSVPQISERGNKLTVRIPPAFTSYLDSFIKYEMKTYGKKAALAATDTDYGKVWVAAFKPAWEAAGGTIVADNAMSYNRATDFYSGVSRVLAAKPDVMFIGGPSEPTGLVAQQARELGFKGGFIIMDQAKLDEVAKVTNGYTPLNGAIGVLPLVDDTTPNAKSFVERFRKSHNGRDPSQEVSLNYTAVYATALAMKLAGTTSDATAIRNQFDKAVKALPQQNNPQSVTGVDDRGGFVIGNPLAAVIQGGQLKEATLSSLTAAK
ncbi:ABC transporter substrate-binding protein [Paraburkholderia antibiotica]|uniref:ABC transporter substrate-binding protein n=1 Tax=Paraburkholderia antibiotica TaxID=2728839 RepID=A0A7Y0A0K4_9BURK|nr:ABC transporter substrate-binding protein [Paraburkholderia antibiotica]NML34296.1 ABC transporter substrate-binding protein [Paraburkholderia antibiotica]